MVSCLNIFKFSSFIFCLVLSYKRFDFFSFFFCDPIRDPICDPVRDPVRSGPIEVLSTPQ